jgi:hypothetical protein
MRMIVLRRRWNGTAVVEGVVQKVVRHSPTGFEWGYGGSGPADLALNILLDYLPYEEAERLYQRFKWDVVARVPREGGVITEQQILDWIRRQREMEGQAA